MPQFDWFSFLQSWNATLIDNLVAENHELGADGTMVDNQSGAGSRSWFGYPGATEAEILDLERRLNVRLPFSYRSFLQSSNGFRQPDNLVPHLHSTHEVNWYRVNHQETIDVWINGLRATEVTDPSLAYLANDPFERYLPTTLQISTVEDGGSAVYLLNPKKVNSNGEWEAFYFAHWIPGVRRYDSFWDLMQAERQNLIYSIRQRRGEPTPQADPALKIEADDFVALMRALADLKPKYRILALEALGNLRDVRAFDKVAQILNDPQEDLFVREAAARTAGMLRDPRSPSLLIEAYRMSNDFDNISTASFQSVLPQFPSDLPPISLEALLRQINLVFGKAFLNKDAIQTGFVGHLRGAIRQGLWELGPGAIPVLREALSDRDPAIRALVAQVLEDLEH